jgi:predicted O-linked N-acetylglucosamine transferase (SPINDLY family)
MPDVFQRVRVLPRTPHNEYLSLLGGCDVLLDTLHYGSDTTAYDAAIAGAPIVTLPGDFHRSRWCAAINRLLGVEQLIADSTSEYVAQAVEVASNPDLNQSLRRQILDANSALFDDQEVVREHEEFFSQAIAAARSHA